MLSKSVHFLKANQTVIRRSLSTSLPAVQKASDPIQQLFVDKVREYADKKKSLGGSGKLVDATPKMESDLQAELTKVAKQYGATGGTDMTKFPDIKFEEPKISTATAEAK